MTDPSGKGRRAPDSTSAPRDRESRFHVLIRLPNWIGDAVMAAPSILALAEELPNLEWGLLGNRRSLPLFEGLVDPFRLLPPLPDHASRPGSFFEAVRSLRRGRWDAALVLPPSFSSAALAALAGIEARFGWPTEGRGPLLTHRVPQAGRDVHLREQYRRLAQELLRHLRGFALGSGVDGDLPAGPLRLPLRAEEIVWARRFWDEQGLDPRRTLVLAPGATYGATKRWPEERFRELSRVLAGRGWSLLWLGGEAERDLGDRLASEGGGASGRSIAGRATLRQSLAVLAGARAAVSNDSGAMHLSQAAGCPVVALFGSTSPPWTGPVGPRQRCLYDALPCSPCFARTCPTEIECLTGITVQRVVEALDELLEATAMDRGRPAVFLDRDGTLLELVPYLHREAEVRLVEGAGQALRRLQQAGYAIVVISNQSVVARGRLDLRGLRAVHRRMASLLAAEGATLDGVEYCPHHPEFDGACACRKPEPGMILRAAHRLELDLGRSFLIGDSETDLAAARRAGVTGVLVRTGYGREVEAGLGSREPDVPVFDDVAAAAGWIVSPNQR